MAVVIDIIITILIIIVRYSKSTLRILNII